MATKSTIGFAPAAAHSFSRTWEDASRKFRDAAGAAGARLAQLPLPGLEGLGIDVAVFERYADPGSS
jgi:hypothetical protein